MSLQNKLTVSWEASEAMKGHQIILFPSSNCKAGIGTMLTKQPHQCSGNQPKANSHLRSVYAGKLFNFRQEQWESVAFCLSHLCLLLCTPLSYWDMWGRAGCGDRQLWLPCQGRMRLTWQGAVGSVQAQWLSKPIPGLRLHTGVKEIEKGSPRWGQWCVPVPPLHGTLKQGHH